MGVSSDYLKITGLNKYFEKDGERFQVLKDINLSVREGEFICIVGASGCGKSTLLRAIAGLDTEHEGEVVVDGKRVTKPEKTRGMVFQEHRLFPWLNVEDNISYVLNEGSKEEKKKKVEKHIELVGLKGFEKAYPKQLSGGMAQRAGIARALVNQPEILLLDEPFGALDAFTKIQMQQEVKRIHHTEGKTMILVTHDIDEAVYLADRIVIMSSRPGTIKRVVNVELAEPRNRNNEEFLAIRKLIFNEFFAEQQIDLDYVI
ncbi:sulfonate transport system ATP-binding protein [Pseudobutyrivibrio sp. OR37]|uniref:ABC transporter ATP-binding protein n=1 Tax=Pseudobutyrivibrio sp. OR37 TaxID=1798186 RepID=UPI0008E69843|nr:ABC transporter ATP-binding protein [Pseudobutyrivibrio sp. OR37]SFI13438.1 sulfonate transport system ATP-binding protein [Pseudobutyrivibrio sp. OR37]